IANPIARIGSRAREEEDRDGDRAERERDAVAPETRVVRAPEAPRDACSDDEPARQHARKEQRDDREVEGRRPLDDRLAAPPRDRRERLTRGERAEEREETCRV